VIGGCLRSALCLTLGAGLFGCQHPENYRWSGNADIVVAPEVKDELETARRRTKIDYAQPWVDVYTYLAPPKDPPPGLTLKDLNGPGQAKAIEVLTRSGAKTGEIWGALSPPSAAGQGADPTITPKRELYRFDRNLVAVVNKGLAAKPGERLMWTWILVKPINFEFAGYSIVQTDNQTLNIEHVMHQTTTQVQGQVSGTLPGPGSVNPSLSGSVQNQYSTSADITQEYENLGVDIMPRFLRIYRESERNRDVAGNTIISLSLVSDPNNLDNHGMADPAVTLLRAAGLKLSRAGALLAPQNASLTIELIESPLHCPLRAQVQLISQIRRIKGDNASYNEGEHHVSIEQLATRWREVPLVSADEAVPAAFGIYYGSGKFRKPVFATTPNGERLQLAFADYESAQAMANWMNIERAHSIGRPPVALTLGGAPIPNPYPLLHAGRIGDGGRPPEAQRRLCDATVLKKVDTAD
jgi:hypothetical protein